MSMYRKCVIPDCVSNSRTERVKFFSLPKQKQTLKKWCANLKMDVEVAKTKHYYVCARHFHTEEYTERKIRDGAVPTLNLGYEPLEQSKVIPQKRKYRRCCFSHCDNTSETCTLFAFPKDIKIRNVWCSIAKISYTTRSFVCDVHFDSKRIKGNKLDARAIPTHYLPCEPSGSHSKPEQTTVQAEDPNFDEVAMLSDVQLGEQKYRVLTEESLDAATPTPKTLTLVIKYCTGKIAELERSLADANLKIKNLEDEQQRTPRIAEPDVKVSRYATQFAKMITNTKQSYTEEEKKLTLGLYANSSSAYNFMRDQLEFNLPSPRSIMNWVESCPL